jgi:hypothetical protein
MPRELLDVLASINVPQFHFEIPTAADNGISSHLYSIDRARMTSELLQHYTGLSIPNADSDILRARDNIALVEGEVKHSRGVVLESPNRPIVVLDVVDNASTVR